MACDSIWLYFAALAWLFSAGLLLPCDGLPIDQIISNAMTSPYTSMHHEKSEMVRVEMDMMFSISDWRNLIALNKSMGDQRRLHKRQAIRDGQGGRYWPGGIIYYQIDHYAFDEEEIRILHEAMNEWMSYTCIQFRPATRYTRNKLRFVDGDGCASNVGMVQNNRLTLSKTCRSKFVVLHELGHTIGFHHEQTRPDRDYYVRILRENIPDYLEYNFHKYTWAVIRNLGVPYDYLSIMHYGKSAFSSGGKVTIETVDKKYQDLIGNRQSLSFRDIKSANKLYDCTPNDEDCQLEDADCPGEGFVGKDCLCWCPSHDVYREIPYYVCAPIGHSTGGSSSSGPDTAGGGELEGACEDRDKNCNGWASRGECRGDFRLYMKANCQRACGLCNAVTSSCRDEYKECGFWRDKGHCEETSSFRRLMVANCRRSCRVCSPYTGQGNSKILPCERTCRNDHDDCEMWAYRGECTRTPDYMHRHCRLACSMCCKAERDKDEVHHDRDHDRATRPPLVPPVASRLRHRHRHRNGHHTPSASSSERKRLVVPSATAADAGTAAAARRAVRLRSKA